MPDPSITLAPASLFLLELNYCKTRKIRTALLREDRSATSELQLVWWHIYTF